MNKLIKIILLTIVFAFGLQFAVFAQTNEVLINQAKEAIEKQDYAAAMNSLNVIFKRDPNDEAALTQRARIFARQSKFAEGLADAAKVLAKNPNNYEALNVRGIVKRENNKDFKGALEDFTQALAIKPDFYLAIVNRGITFARLGKAAESITEFDKGIALSPNNFQAYSQKALVLTNLKKFKEAIAVYDKAILLDGKNDVFYANRGFCSFQDYFNNGTATIAQMKKDAETALQINPNNSLGLALRGISKFDGMDQDGAIIDAEKSIQINPKSYLGYIIRGLVKTEKKDFDGAFNDMDQALKLAPRDGWAKQNWEMAARNSPTAQAKLLETAKQKVAANPWNFTAYDELKDALNRANADNKAYWESLLSQNPKNICAIRFLGEYKGNQYYMDMVNFLDDGLRLYDGKNGAECAAEIARRIAREYDSRQRYDLAKTYYDKAKSIKSDLGGLDSNIAEMDRIIERNKTEDERLTKRLAELDKTRKQTSDSTVKKMSDQEFQAILAVLTEFKKLNEHTKLFSDYAKTWNSDIIEQERDLALSMKTECETVLAIAENLLNKYPSNLSANDTDYLKKTIIKYKANLAKIEIELKKL